MSFTKKSSLAKAGIQVLARIAKQLEEPAKFSSVSPDKASNAPIELFPQNQSEKAKTPAA